MREAYDAVVEEREALRAEVKQLREEMRLLKANRPTTKFGRVQLPA